MPFDDQTTLTDDILIVRFANGDADAARVLTERHAPRSLGYAYRLVGDRAEAEDIAQDAMLRLWKIAPDWRPGEAQISTWLYRVVTNLCTDRLRKRRGVGLDEAPEIEDGAKSAEDQLQDQARAQALEAALQQLPERQRQAVVLRHIEGMRNPEIAAVLDLSVEAVESLTARGKRALAGILSGKREELGYENDR